MQARRTTAKIFIDAADVTRDLSPYIKKISYEDLLSGETDSLTLELEDRKALFIGDWFPERGSTLRVILVNDNELDLGSFEVDELDYSFPPSNFKLKANSCPEGTALRQIDSSRSWENTQLSVIARDIAAEAGVQLFYKTQEDPQIVRAERGDESALAFLQKLCRKYYLALKFSDGQLIIFDEKELDAQEPALTIKRGDNIFKRLHVTASLTEVYKACEVTYKHGKQDKLFRATCDDPRKSKGKTLKINRRVESQAECERVAENELRDKNKREFKLNLICAGDFRLVAGNVFALEGFGVFDKNWLIEKATHSIGDGYEVRLEARQCLPT